MYVSLYNPKTLLIQFKYKATLVEKIKTLHTRKYDATKKAWLVPNSDYAIKKLKEWGFSFDPLLQENTKRKKKSKEHEIITKATLRDYQKEGVNFFFSHNAVLLADEQGLGKTVQTISYINSAKKFPALIICPSSVKLNWRKEVIKWTDDSSIYVAYGKNPDVSSIRGYNWIIINYDILTYWQKVIMDSSIHIMVLDESQNIRNMDSKRCEAVLTIGKIIPSRVALSGTPISNRPIEFYSTFKLLDPHLFPSKFKFGKKFCGLKNNGFGWDYSGSSNTQELFEILKENFMLRRKKSDVLKDLPPKQKVVVPLEMTKEGKKKYQKAEKELMDFLKYMPKKEAPAKALVRLNSMRKMLAKAKLDSVINWIEDFLESDKKLVVFAWHQEVISALMDHFKKIAVRLDGSCSDVQRQQAVDLFQNDKKVRLFVGNIKAAGMGITLTESSNTATIELCWSPSDLAQAEDRVHRIGQKDPVNNYYLLCEDTIDEYMMRIIDEKQKVIDAIMDGKDTEEKNILSALLNHYYEKK